MPLTDSNAPEGGQPKLRSSCEDAKPPLDYVALVIGINSYKSIRPKLAGAVADAKKFAKLLLEKLVWEDKTPLLGEIQILCDEKATRSAIIQALASFKDNDQIVQGRTAMIMYYAGHGARAKTPIEWTDWTGTGGYVELLCPVDSETILPADGKVDSIPDRTINYILRDLSAAKGNNITLIFDCCHSAGMNRALNSNGTVVRGLVDILTISAECDTDIVSLERGHSNRETPSSNEVHEGSCASWDTHILLAACARGQEARERDSQGDFTRALLDVLGTVPIFDLTYRSLMHRLRMPAGSSQTPHLDGKHINRCIFTLSQEAEANSMIHCSPLKCPNSIWLSLHAGSVQGVVTGSIYDIYDSELPKSVPLVTAEVASVDLFTSELKPLGYSPKGSNFTQKSSADSIWYAQLSKDSCFKFLIYCNDLDFHILHQVFDETPDDKIKLIYPLYHADSPEKADICLKVEGNRVLFSRGGTNSFVEADMEKPGHFFQLIGKLLPSYFSYKPLAGDINRIRVFLNHYACFNYHITMRGSVDLEDLVSIEMHQLKRDEEDNFHIVDGRNMLSDLQRRDCVKITVTTVESLNDARSSNEAFRYGFTIQSRSEQKLYPHILCFDPSTLEIDVVYSNMTSTRNLMGELNVETCLSNKDSIVSFGLGDSMVQPFLFSLSGGQNVDIQFIKILVTTEPVDLRCILQPSVEASGLQ
ncbi:caspase domain-containing protein [Armillaria nabsnona]|nr:caspase domain-containing protein [Armillaria nabsnona]